MAFCLLLWLNSRAKTATCLALALTTAACATASQTSLATLIGPDERAAAADKPDAATITEDGAVSQSAAVSTPLNRVLATSGNVQLPIQVAGLSGGVVLTSAFTNVAVASPALNTQASVGVTPTNGVQAAARTPLASVGAQLNPGALTPGGSAPVLGASATTTVASVNLASSPTAPLNAQVGTPLGGATVAVATPVSGPLTVNAGLGLTPVLPAANVGVSLGGPVGASAGSVLNPVLGAASPVTSALTPALQTTTGAVSGLLGSLPGLK